MGSGQVLLFLIIWWSAFLWRWGSDFIWERSQQEQIPLNKLVSVKFSEISDNINTFWMLHCTVTCRRERKRISSHVYNTTSSRFCHSRRFVQRKSYVLFVKKYLWTKVRCILPNFPTSNVIFSLIIQTCHILKREMWQFWQYLYYSIQ